VVVHTSCIDLIGPHKIHTRDVTDRPILRAYVSYQDANGVWLDLAPSLNEVNIAYVNQTPSSPWELDNVERLHCAAKNWG